MNSIKKSISLVAQMGNNPPAMQKTQVQSPGQEDCLEQGMATHPSILDLENWWEPGGLEFMESQRVRHN